MDIEEFADFVRAVIADEISCTAPCGCCGAVEIEGQDEAVARIVEAAQSITR